MTGTTPIYALPYLQDGDPLADLPESLEALAEQVESSLAGFGGVASPGSWLTPSYATGWADWSDTTNELLRYRKVGTEVTLNGICRRTSGSSGLITTLPAGYRPTRTTTRPASSNLIPGLVTVEANGDVTFVPGPSASFANGHYVTVWAKFHTDQP